jgi:hypothetical protein
MGERPNRAGATLWGAFMASAEERELRRAFGGAGWLHVEMCALSQLAKLLLRGIRFAKPVNRHATIALWTELADVRLVYEQPAESAPTVECFAVDAVPAAGFAGNRDLQVLAVLPTDAVTGEQRAVAVVRRFNAMAAARANGA